MATAEEVGTLVEERVIQMRTIAEDAVANAQAFLDDLAQAIPATPPYLEGEDFPTDISRISVDTVTPDRPNIENLVDDATIPEIGDLPIPDAPEPTLPAELTLNDITLPTPPSVDIVPFTLDFPDDTISDTDIQNFEYTESEYTSALKDAVFAKLVYDVENGGTGLDPSVETAIFERQAERDLIALEEAVERVKSEWAASGFPLPNGTLLAQVQDLYEKYENTKLDRSRDIAIKQAELAQGNTHFAISSSLTMEGMLIQHFNNVANRALEAAKSTINLGIALFNVQVERFKTRLESYRTGAQAYEAQIRAELAKVEIYKAEMEGARLEATVQEQRVSAYRQQIEAVNAIYNQYRTQVDAVRIKAGIESERLTAFRTRVQAQLDKVRALVATYEADTSRYNATIREGEAWANTKIKQQELLSKNHETALSLALENAKANLQAFINISGMKIQQAQGGAAAYTTLAAAAMDSLNAVVQLASSSTISATEQ